MERSKWADDAFLDTLRDQGDALADQTVAELAANSQWAAANRIFRAVDVNSPSLPEDAPDALKRFWSASAALPPGVDLERLERGHEAFLRHVFEMGGLLLTRSLPAGYAAPRLAQTLTISGDLVNASRRRVLAVVQLLVEIGGHRGFQDGGSAVAAAQKMRLLHAGVRRLVPSARPQFRVQHPGMPVSLEDMLGTLMGFSYLPIDSLRAIVGDLRPQSAEDIYYLWQVYGVMMGIHPPLQHPDDQPSFDYIPATLEEAATFYQSYARRNYVEATANPDGVTLARADLSMMQGLIPRWLQWLGVGIVPRLLMHEALKPEAMLRVGIEPVSFFRLRKALCLDLPLFVDGLFHRMARNRHGAFAEVILRDLVEVGRDGKVSFFVPDSVESLRQLG